MMESRSHTLVELQRLMHSLIRREVSPAEVACSLDVPVERVALYQSMARGRIETALVQTYACLSVVLGPVKWARVLDGYCLARPATTYDLLDVAGGFPAFVWAAHKRGEYGLSTAHGELVELEWRELEALNSQVEIPAREDARCPSVNPTLVILEFSFSVGSFLRDWRCGLGPVFPDTPNPQTVFVFRNPQTHSSGFCVVELEELLAFKVSHDGTSVESAARESGLSMSRVMEILAAASKTGFVVLPETNLRSWVSASR